MKEKILSHPFWFLISLIVIVMAIEDYRRTARQQERCIEAINRGNPRFVETFCK